GFVALLVHMVVDFQVYQFGVAAALIGMLALIAALRGGAAEVQLPKTVCLAATAVLMAVSVPLLAFLSPRALAADGELSDARIALAGLQRGLAGDPRMVVPEGLRVAESSQTHNPFNPEAYQLYANLKFYEWGLRAGEKDAKDLEAIEGMTLQA